MDIFVPKNIEAVLEGLEDENDRAVALVGASLVEHALQEAIRSVLRPINESEDSELLGRVFGHRGLFAGISGKILGAYILKIIGKRTRRDLELINRIRNLFAHDMNPLDFFDERIESRCNELYVAKDSLADDPRKKYLVAVRFYSAALTLWSIRELMEKDERFDILDYLTA